MCAQAKAGGRPLDYLTRFGYPGRIDHAWGAHVWFKMEMLMTTGSFKERGAFYKLSSLDADEPDAGVDLDSIAVVGQALAWFRTSRREAPAA